nr:hypothetical protein [Candidatus Krumholzibacteria bacterium]
MKRPMIFLMIMSALTLLASGALAQDTDPVTNPGGGFGPGDGSGECQFIDEDGDGFNDLAPDHDGDGIPNGLDPDYVRPEDGTGAQNQYRFGVLVDVFGRGFATIALQGEGSGHMFGLRDGSGTGFGPADGTGFGPGSGNSPGDGVGQGQGQSSSGSNGNGQGGQGSRR